MLRRKGTHSHRLAGPPQRRRAPSRTQAEKCARCRCVARTHPHLVGTPGSSSENSSRQMLHAGRQGRAVCSADNARLASSTPPVARGQRPGHWRAIRPLAAQVEGYARGTPLCGEASKGAYLQISCSQHSYTPQHPCSPHHPGAMSAPSSPRRHTPRALAPPQPQATFPRTLRDPWAARQHVT